MRTYELMFVVDPRVSDDDVVTMTQDYKQMITAVGGAEITSEENWGRRKLAYSIDKVTEGKYVLLYIQSPGGKTSLPEVEHRMRQNDKILRFLTVRTDEDLKRAARKQPAGGSGGGSPDRVSEPMNDDDDSGEEV
ncbi:MAG TPA: 30S ribosomal protein S6 [Thermoanaerobaculia bacterium]|nr:30S ribosomal protein S6 [Thermoanaerobaculia bacterium]